MAQATFSDFTAVLYYVSFVILAGLTLYIAVSVRSTDRRNTRLKNSFLRLAFALFSWLFTVFLEVRAVLPVEQLWVGRFNFAIGAILSYQTFRFVQIIVTRRGAASTVQRSWLLVSTVVLFAMTMLTPLVDAAESTNPNGRAHTHFGMFYPAYLLHVLLCLGLALSCALGDRSRELPANVRRQSFTVGTGLLVVGPLALITNGLLPYLLNDYRFCDIGPLSTVVFLLAVAYATFKHRLFGIRFLVRMTLVYGLLLTFVVGAFRSAALLAGVYFTGGSQRMSEFSVLALAFAFEPLRRFLDKHVDRLLFAEPSRKDNSHP